MTMKPKKKRRAEVQYVHIDWDALKKTLREVSADVNSWGPWKAETKPKKGGA